MLRDSIGSPSKTTALLRIKKSEKTHHRGKYHCTADRLFDWFGFDQTSKTVIHST